MSTIVWQLQEAKSRFSEVVEQAVKHGRPTVVIISPEEYERSKRPTKPLMAALRACPEDLTSLVGRRSKEPARKIKLG